MSEPKRWLGGASEVPDGAERYLRSARRSRSLSADARARSAARVANITATAVVASTALRWGKGIALAATIGLGSYIATHTLVPAVRRAYSSHSVRLTHRAAVPSEAPPGAVPVAPATAVPTRANDHLADTTLPVASVQRAPSQTTAVGALRAGPPASRARGSDPSIASPLPPDDALARESELLRPAHAALEHDPRMALALLAPHARAFPNGQLVEEREWIAFDALRRLGRHREARARGEAFIRRFPHSYNVERVRHVLEGLE